MSKTATGSDWVIMTSKQNMKMQFRSCDVLTAVSLHNAKIAGNAKSGGKIQYQSTNELK